MTRRPLRPRRPRSYPRVIKRARHNSYRVKRAADTGTRHQRPPTIRLYQPDEPLTSKIA